MEPIVKTKMEDHPDLLPAIHTANLPDVGFGVCGSTVPPDITTLQEGLRSTVTGSQSSTDTATEDFTGQHELQLEFELDGITKSVMCKCSPELNKLFCQTSEASPVLIRVQSFSSSGPVPQTMKVYKKSKHITKGVNQDPSNRSSVDFGNVSTHPSHLILIEENPMAHSTKDENHSASGPYKDSQVGSQSSNVLTNDVQNNTHPGGMNRQIILTVTLDSKEGILDQRRFEACIVDFPCKDHQMERKNILKKEQKRKGIMAFPHVPPVLDPLLSIKQHEEEIFTLRIRGRKRYKVFKKLNDALNLQDRRKAMAEAFQKRRDAKNTQGTESKNILKHPMPPL